MGVQLHDDALGNVVSFFLHFTLKHQRAQRSQRDLSHMTPPIIHTILRSPRHNHLAPSPAHPSLLSRPHACMHAFHYAAAQTAAEPSASRAAHVRLITAPNCPRPHSSSLLLSSPCSSSFLMLIRLRYTGRLIWPYLRTQTHQWVARGMGSCEREWGRMMG